MENFILYEELGAGHNSTVYKGRRKGNLSYVRLSQDLDHLNIVRFHEWYETGKHLWLVVELCTGGSLESVIAHDGCLPEDVVRRFGWDLVKGLKHIHESGIIVSDLTPAKILLDGSGILKFGNFSLSKTVGETLDDIIVLISTSKESGEGDNVDNIRKRFQGCPTYRAPEVLQGSETSVSSDLWALGCILYYMYTGIPPSYLDKQAELTEMILHQDSPPLSHTSPLSPDFQSLLKGLLNKNVDKRIDWPELLDHPFWKQLIKKEDNAEDDDEKSKTTEKYGCEGAGMVNLGPTRMHGVFPPGHTVNLSRSYSAITQPGYSMSKKLISSYATSALPGRPSNNDTVRQQSVKDIIYETMKNSHGSDTEIRKERRGEDAKTVHDPEHAGVEQMCCTVQPNKSLLTDNLMELKPKNGVDEDNTEAIFLLSPCTSSRRSSNTAVSPNQHNALEAGTDIDIKNCVKRLLHTDADLTVTPIIDNPKILKSTPVRFDPKTLCVPAYSVEKLQSLSDEEWAVFLLQVCSPLEEQTSSTSVPRSNFVPPSTTIRSKLNLLCYLCCVVGHTIIADKMINSTLLLVLTKQLRQAPNWDVRSKVLRVMGLLALHCSHLEEDSSVSEAVSTLADLLRENLRNNKLKQLLIPPLGEFLYLICSQEEKRGSPEGLWFVPAAAYTGLMRSLREGDDAVVHHMAAKTVENISTAVSTSSHHLVTPETGSAMWYLFTHSTVEAVRVTAISSLSKLTRLDPAVFLSVIDTCGHEAILEGIGGAGARVQQHLLTALATGLLASHIQTHRIAQSQDLLLKVLRCLESPSTVTRAKAILLLLLLLQDSTHTLLYCCQHRLVMYLERELRKAAPLRENPSQSGYLSQCLELLIVHLCGTAPAIMEDVLSALKGVIGRKHPTKAQSRQLKQTLPTITVMQEILSSQVFRSRIVTKQFLVQIGLLLKYVASVTLNEPNLASAVGAAVCEELIRTTLSIVEILSQHHTLITPFHCTVVDDVLLPLTTLAFSTNVEWSVFALKLLAELSLVLLVQEDDHTEDNEEGTREKKEIGETDQATEGGEDGGSCSQTLFLFTKSLLSRYDSLLCAAEPIPLYALKLLVSLTEHSTQICRLINHSTVLPVVLRLIMASSVTSGLVQNAVVLLCNISGNTVFDQQPPHQEGLIEVVVSTFTQTARVYLDAGRKVSHMIQALLELLHNVLKQTSVVIRAALQSQRLSCPAAETEAAEKLLAANRPLSQLSIYLIQMLSTENQELWEESSQCLSLLVQIYGGEGHDCLSPTCLQSFSHILQAHMDANTPQVQRTTLKIIKRLVQTTDGSDWLECREGEELMTTLKDMTSSNRCHAEVIPLAAELIQEIFKP
ncbi:serine/threonine-protein kinase ULK4 [Cololabis saira]|uniref:serine/threonine-protein kinase ULK4 n=1 Tax=Cololabis saira TaxID=129043 RepID=UPI002AD35DD8|nr:serine/threonine-protein kinase ULK4 [Cololabis saira]